MSDTEQDTPIGGQQEPAARSDGDRELAERDALFLPTGKPVARGPGQIHET